MNHTNNTNKASPSIYMDIVLIQVTISLPYAVLQYRSNFGSGALQCICWSINNSYVQETKGKQVNFLYFSFFLCNLHYLSAWIISCQVNTDMCYCNQLYYLGLSWTYFSGKLYPTHTHFTIQICEIKNIILPWIC